MRRSTGSLWEYEPGQNNSPRLYARKGNIILAAPCEEWRAISAKDARRIAADLVAAAEQAENYVAQITERKQAAAAKLTADVLAYLEGA